MITRPSTTTNQICMPPYIIGGSLVINSNTVKISENIGHSSEYSTVTFTKQNNLIGSLTISNPNDLSKIITGNINENIENPNTILLLDN